MRPPPPVVGRTDPAGLSPQGAHTLRVYPEVPKGGKLRRARSIVPPQGFTGDGHGVETGINAETERRPKSVRSPA
jgi:hypothetical protein